MSCQVVGWGDEPLLWGPVSKNPLTQGRFFFFSGVRCVKIVSWNVNGIRAAGPKGLLDFLESEDPDILCLQESKAHPLDLSLSLRNPWGRKSYWSFADTKGYSGTVTFVKKPALKVEYGIGIKKFDNEGRFVLTDHGRFLLFNVYFPNGSRTQERHLFKQDFLQVLAGHVKSILQTGREVIVLGDYNTAYLDFDVFDPKGLKTTSGFLPEERKWFKEFLALGFVDVFRHFYPHKKNIYTWWSYRENARKHNRGWRIDHICVSRGLVKGLKSSQVFSSQQGSDHCPVELVLA